MKRPQSFDRRREVFSRYARMMPPRLREPMRCIPTREERAQGVEPAGIIFDTADAAQAAAVELRKLDGRPQYPYRCPRHRPGSDGHWHVSTVRPSRHLREAS